MEAQSLWPEIDDLTDAFERFKNYTIYHRILSETYEKISQVIEEPASFAFVFLYGPSGVGKTTLIQKLKEKHENVKSPPMSGLAPVPLLLLEARPPEGTNFNRTEYYRVALKQLDEYPYGPLWEHKRERGKGARFNDSSELREIYEAALQRRGVQTIIVDEAQHLLKISKGVELVDQLDWLKSMTNATGVLHVLTGTYELLPLSKLSGQLARRRADVHFPRYHFQHEPDQHDFQSALFTLLQHIPFKVDVEKLLQKKWDYFYERSIGCIGILKDWLVRATAVAIKTSQRSPALDFLDYLGQCAPSFAQCENMAREAITGERTLQYVASDRQKLQTILGMNMPVEEAEEQMEPVQDVPDRNQKTHANEQQQTLFDDEVVKNGKKKQNCPFSGVKIPLQSVQLRNSGVERLQCTECRAVRKAVIRKGAVMYDDHEPVKRLRKGPRWVCQGTKWVLVDA